MYEYVRVKMNINENYSIEKVSDSSKLAGLRNLWSRVFGDPEEYVDWMYETFDDITGYVVADAEGRVVSALTLYKCGEFKGAPVYVSYAVCTDPEFRGAGLASELVSYVRDEVTEAGGISLVSPAEESLIEFYEELGYEPYFMANEAVAYPDYLLDDDDFDEDDDFEAFDPGLSVMPCDTSVYNMYREAFLADVPHIELSEKMLDVVKAESQNSNGLFIINGGDAICTICSGDENKPYVAELLVNPMLMEFSFEIESEIAARLAKHLEVDTLAYRSAGYGKCQSMVACDMRKLISEVDTDAADGHGSDANEGGILREMPPFFGFPLD